MSTYRIEEGSVPLDFLAIEAKKGEKDKKTERVALQIIVNEDGTVKLETFVEEIEGGSTATYSSSDITTDEGSSSGSPTGSPRCRLLEETAESPELSELLKILGLQRGEDLGEGNFGKVCAYDVNGKKDEKVALKIPIQPQQLKKERGITAQIVAQLKTKELTKALVPIVGVVTNSATKERRAGEPAAIEKKYLYYCGVGNPAIMNMIKGTEEIAGVLFSCVDGCDLFELITTQHNYEAYGKPSEQSVVAWKEDKSKELMNIVKILHTLGLIHRDIKLDNVMITLKTGSLQMIDTDFLAKLDENGKIKGSGSGIGSTGHIAPEVSGPISKRKRRGDEDYTYGTEADVWSTGISVYTLLLELIPPWWQKTVDTCALEDIRCKERKAVIEFGDRQKNGETTVRKESEELYHPLYPCTVKTMNAVSPEGWGWIEGMLTVDPSQRTLGL